MVGIDFHSEPNSPVSRIANVHYAVDVAMSDGVYADVVMVRLICHTGAC